MKILLVPAIFVMLALIPLLFTSHALAQVREVEDDSETVGFYNARTDTIIVSMRFEHDDSDMAKAVATEMDGASASENLDVAIVRSDPLDENALDLLDASAGHLMGGKWMETGQPMMLLVFSQDEHLYVSMMIGDDLDGTAFATYSVALAEDGLDADPPRGFKEVDVNNDSRI